MYQKGEVVWAKVKGFPWWPGVVAKVADSREKELENQFLVKFIGDKSHAFLNNEKVAKFAEKFELYTKDVKQKRLIDSIELAQRMATGETAYENEINQVEHIEFEVVNKRKKIRKTSKRNDDKESDSSTETGSKSKSPNSDNELMQVEFEAEKREKNKRKNKTITDSKSAYLAVKESEKSSFRRKTLNSQNTDYTCEQLIETEFRGTVKSKRTKKSNSQSESASRTDSTRHNIEREFSDKASETNGNILPIDHELSDLKTSTNKTDSSVTAVSKKLGQVFIAKGTKSMSRFKKQTGMLRKKLQEVEDVLVRYLADQNYVMALTTLLQECLNDFSVENLSPSELMDYILDDMGKLLYSLVALLDEFEKVCLEAGIELHPTLKLKIKSVKVQYNRLKEIIASDFLENVNFAKIYTDDLQRMFEKKQLDEEMKKRELEELNQKLELLNKEKELQQEKANFLAQTNEKNEMEIEPMTNNTSSMQPKEDCKLTVTPPINLKEKVADPEELKPTADLNMRYHSAPQLLVTPPKQQEMLPEVPDQSITTKNRTQSVPDYSCEVVCNPNLRKQVVLQLVKYLQKKYELNQEVAREMTMLIERTVRLSSPEMKEEYKKRYNLIVELMKHNLITLDIFSVSKTPDWEFLQAKMENSNNNKTVSSNKKKKGKSSKDAESNKNFSQKSNKDRSMKKSLKSQASDENSTAYAEDF